MRSATKHPQLDEESRLGSALERSGEALKRLRQQRAQDLLDTGGTVLELPSVQEQYEFFAGRSRADAVVDSRREDRPKVSGQLSDSPALAEIGMAGLDAKMVRIKPTPIFTQLQEEAKVYFTPTLDSVPLSAKLAEGAARRLSSEGLVHRVPLAMSARNVNTWEQRLLQTSPNNALGWFDDGGRLLTVDPCVAQFPLRDELSPANHLVHFCKPVARTATTVAEQTDERRGLYQLDLELQSIAFVHHAYFGVEHVAVSRFLEKYSRFVQLVQDDDAGFYWNKLIALEKGLELLQPRNGKAAKARHLLLKEQHDIRQKFELAESSELTAAAQAIESWHLVNSVRAKQGYTATPYRLEVHAEAADEQIEVQQWESDVQTELEYRRMMVKKPGEEDDNSADSTFDLDRERSAIEERMAKNRRKPGTPLTVPILKCDASVTQFEQCPAEEQNRRKAASKLQYSAAVSVDGASACHTGAATLSGDIFMVQLGRVLSVDVFDRPRGVTVTLVEHVGGARRPIAVVGVPLPAASQMSTNERRANATAMHFASTQTSVSFDRTKTTAVGAGNPIDLSDYGVRGESGPVHTSGVLHCALSWGRAKDGTPLVPPSVIADERREMEQEAEMRAPKNKQQLRRLMNQCELDLNDPENSFLLELLLSMDPFSIQSALEDDEITDTAGGNAIDRPGTRFNEPEPFLENDTDVSFSLEPPEMSLVSVAEFYADARLKALQLRARGEPEFRALRMVPPDARLIGADIFKRYERRLEREQETEKIRAQVRSRFTRMAGYKSYEDVVNEPPMPDLSFFGALLFGQIEVERPLRPVRRTTAARRGSASAAALRGAKIVVNVQTGVNIPTRAHTPVDGVLVEPFFEVTYEKVTARTSAVVGRNPTWQQTLDIDFRPPNDDFSSENLKSISSPIFLHLFDQLLSDLPKDNREGQNTVKQQIEKRWLGSIRIPFSTLYYNGKIEGSLRIQVPPVFLGYEMQHRLLPGPTSVVATESPGAIGGAATAANETSVRLHPYVKVLLALDPPLPLPEPAALSHLETIESDATIQSARRWLADVQEHHPDRRYVAYVLDTHGRTVLPLRYLRPIQPPADIVALNSRDGQRQAAKLACHIVSLIPFVADPVIFPGMSDVWATCDEFVSMLCGDEEEHAVLLYCWLSSLDISCYLVLGRGLPEGPHAAYVLAHFDTADAAGRRRLLFNASDGHAYSLDDAFCPMTSVGTLVTESNMWANVQPHHQPAAMTWDVSRPADWRPMFPVLKTQQSDAAAERQARFESVQPAALAYAATDADAVHELRGHLERAIRHQFDQWRPHGIPQWNYHAGMTLRELLPLLEECRLTTEQHEERLKSLTDAYKMSGFPLHMAYSSEEQVLSAVRATNVHLNYNPAVEFALAVHIHAYTDNILSLWVYVASLVRLRA